MKMIGATSAEGRGVLRSSAIMPLRRTSGLQQDQLNHADVAAFPQLNRRLSSAMKRDALSWNRRQRPNAFLRITMSVSDVPQHFDFP